MAQINKPTDYFNTKLYTGTGSAQSITGINFQPDLVWIKGRNNGNYHRWFDVVRGVPNYIGSNAADAEASDATQFTSFDSDGFTLSTGGATNGSGYTFASWNWLGANGTASNTDGSITSTVSANTISGFSIGTYTGTGASATIGHGLGTSPSMVIIKRTDSAENWRVHHVGLTGLTYRLALDTTQAEYDETTSGLQSWNSSTFTLGSGGSYNASGGSFVFYAFSEKKGFSKFGSYTGNGNSDGTFIYTGFKPAWVMIKRSNSAGEGWNIYDNKRNTFNLVTQVLTANLSNAEATATAGADVIDMLSQGFKCRGTHGAINGSGNTFIYMAFAENPLVGTNNIPATAR